MINNYENESEQGGSFRNQYFYGCKNKAGEALPTFGYQNMIAGCVTMRRVDFLRFDW